MIHHKFYLTHCNGITLRHVHFVLAKSQFDQKRFLRGPRSALAPIFHKSIYCDGELETNLASEGLPPRALFTGWYQYRFRSKMHVPQGEAIAMCQARDDDFPLFTNFHFPFSIRPPCGRIRPTDAAIFCLKPANLDK